MTVDINLMCPWCDQQGARETLMQLNRRGFSGRRKQEKQEGRRTRRSRGGGNGNTLKRSGMIYEIECFKAVILFFFYHTIRAKEEDVCV